MNPELIRNFEASRSLDAMIAEHVLGLDIFMDNEAGEFVCRDRADQSPHMVVSDVPGKNRYMDPRTGEITYLDESVPRPDHYNVLPQFSTNGDWAQKVGGFLIEAGRVDYVISTQEHGFFRTSFRSRGKVDYADAPTLALAICRACLLIHFAE